MPTHRVRRLAATGLVVALAVVAAATPASVAAATTITVNTLADTVNATDGKCSLREALTSVNTKTASGGVAGECPAGSGTDTIAFKVGGTITLAADPVTITAGTLTIDGASVITIDGASLYRAFDVGSGTVTIAHLATQHTSGAGGGAVLSSGTTRLSDVTIRTSASSDVGGGVKSTGALTLDRSTITGATAAGRGGAVYQEGGSLTLTSSVVEQSSVTGGGSADGAGIFATGATVSLTASRIASNTGDTNTAGGGVAVEGASTLSIARSRITANSAGSGGGGGLFVNGAGITVTVTDTTIDGNQTPSSGGAIRGTWSTFRMQRSTVSGNTATGSGGGFQLDAGSSDIVNSTIYGNTSATAGGAVFTSSASVRLIHATVTANTSPVASAAVENTGPDPTVVIANSIIGGNTTVDIKGMINQDFVILGAVTTILDQGGLKDHGGPTKTVALLKTAPFAVDKASDTYCSMSIVGVKDQRGAARKLGVCDYGAYEIDTTKPTAAAPRGVPAAGASIGSKVPVRITSPSTDSGGSGIARFVLQKSVNGGTWSTVTSTMPATGITLSLTTGSSYRFRVKPVDFDGNVGTYSSAGTIGTPAIRQQTSATFSGSWSTSSSTSYSGGSAKRSSSAGASVKYSFTGRAIGFVSTLGPDRGQIRVYIDGVLKSTVDLYAASTRYKVVAWSQRFSSSASHTIKVVVVGTPARPRVDVDAFTVLK